MNCVSCNNLIAETQQSHKLSDLGVELTVVLEEQLHPEVDHEGVLCNNCFDIAVSRLSQRPGTPRPSRCVWCLDPIIGRHTHSHPEGLEREYIAHCILPRQVQPQSKVCYACWLAACRNVQRQPQQGLSSDMLHNEDHHIDLVESRLSTSNEMANCIWCEYSIAGSHSHSLPEGVEREIVAARILPREIGSSRRVCYACWMAARRLSTQSAPPPTVCMLPNYRKAGNSSNRCFVIGCARPERHRIPLFLKIKLLKLYKLYLPNNARICNEHLGLYDWDLLHEQIYGQRYHHHHNSL